MKKALCIIAAIMLFAAPAMSDDLAKCEKIGNLAGLIMEKRQGNVAMSEIVNVFPADSPWIKVVIKAYEQPRWSVERNRAKAVVEFKNQMYLECLKMAGK